MVLSVPVIALGATLGTATSILALCGVTCLCRHMHPKKGLLQRDRDPDPEKARPGVLRPAQQVSGAAPQLLCDRCRLQVCGGGGTRGGGSRRGFFFARQRMAGSGDRGRARGTAEGSGKRGWASLVGGRLRGRERKEDSEG